MRGRPLGLWLIIAYKLAKAPVMLALAVWLSLGPFSAIYIGKRVIAGALGWRRRT